MKAVCAIFFILLFLPSPAAATQGHVGLEGLYVHQIAHLFFLFAMGLLIYWLRSRRLVDQAGWRLIQYAAFFFILWNLDAFAAHWFEEQSTLLTISQPELWRIHIESPPDYPWLGTVYYLVKLDHLLSVPGVLFLFLGLRRLARQDSETKGETAP